MYGERYTLPDKTKLVLLVAFLFGNFCVVSAINNNISTLPLAISMPGSCYGTPFIYIHSLHRCCRVCPPGSGIISPCTSDSNSECAPCPPGRYSPISDHEEGCHRCPFCPENSHQIQECTSVKPTECECDMGYFKNSMLGICERCTFCEHGFGALASCTPNRNTVCERCPNGTFSDVLALDSPCRPCQKCTKAQLMTSPCTLESNGVCEESPYCYRLSILYLVDKNCEKHIFGILATIFFWVFTIAFLIIIVNGNLNHPKHFVLFKLKAKVDTVIENGNSRKFFVIDATRIDAREIFPRGCIYSSRAES